MSKTVEEIDMEFIIITISCVGSALSFFAKKVVEHVINTHYKIDFGLKAFFF